MAAKGEADDLLQVAWLYHVGHLSQEEVSRRLGMSRAALYDRRARWPEPGTPTEAARRSGGRPACRIPRCRCCEPSPPPAT